MAADLYHWRFIRKGETLPQDAVLGSTDSKHGDLYIGQVNGQIGRITVEKEGVIPNQIRKMHKFTHHGDGSWFGITDCQVLCATQSTRIEWIDCKKHDPIPPNAVLAGETPKDGKTYVARASDPEKDLKGDIGKFNTDNGHMYNFWCASYAWSGNAKAQLLIISRPVYGAAVVQPAIQPVVAAVPVIAEVTQPENSLVQRSQDFAVPNAPREFPGLNNVSEKELQTMRANSLLVDNWLMDQKEVKEYSDRAQRLRQENAELAVGVLSMESDFLNAQQTFENRSADLAVVQSRVGSLVEQRSQILQQRSPDEMRRVLDASAQNHDNVSEQSLQSTLMTMGAFQNGQLAEFRQAYLKNKIEAHRMKALSTRLQKTAEA